MAQTGGEVPPTAGRQSDDTGGCQEGAAVLELRKPRSRHPGTRRPRALQLAKCGCVLVRASRSRCIVRTLVRAYPVYQTYRAPDAPGSWVVTGLNPVQVVANCCSKSRHESRPPPPPRMARYGPHSFRNSWLLLCFSHSTYNCPFTRCSRQLRRCFPQVGSGQKAPDLWALKVVYFL